MHIAIFFLSDLLDLKLLAGPIGSKSAGSTQLLFVIFGYAFDLLTPV
jgi:hypothetical protein